MYINLIKKCVSEAEECELKAPWISNWNRNGKAKCGGVEWYLFAITANNRGCCCMFFCRVAYVCFHVGEKLSVAPRNAH